jgi:hypothetical protein
MPNTINFEAYLCIAAELLAGNMYVQSAMIRSINTMACYHIGRYEKSRKVNGMR